MNPDARWVLPKPSRVCWSPARLVRAMRPLRRQSLPCRLRALCAPVRFCRLQRIENRSSNLRSAKWWVRKADIETPRT